MDLVILGTKAHPLGGFYLAQREDGKLLAGASERSTRLFDDAQAVYDHFYPIARNGAHWAWNICYLVEDLLR